MKPVLQIYLCDCTAKALWGVASLILIRFMPHQEYAQLTLAIAVSTLLVTGVAANLNTVYMVGFDQLQLNRSPLSVLALELWLFAVVAILSLPVGLCTSTASYALIVLLSFANFLFHFGKACFQRALMFTSFALVELARTSLFLIAVGLLIGLVRTDVHAWQVILLQSAAILVVVGSFFGTRLLSAATFNPQSSLELARQLVRGKYTYMIGYYLLLAVFLRVDVLMLRVLEESDELASYGAAFRYQSLILIFLNSIHTVFLPLAQRAARRDELAVVFARHNRMLVVLIPLVVLAAVLAQWIIPLVDNGRYPGSISLFRVLALSAAVSLAFSPHVNVLLRYANFAFLFYLVCLALLVNVGANLLLIPQLHALGAAISTLLSVGLVNGLIYARSRLLLASYPLPDSSSAVMAR